MKEFAYGAVVYVADNTARLYTVEAESRGSDAVDYFIKDHENGVTYRYDSELLTQVDTETRTDATTEASGDSDESTSGDDAGGSDAAESTPESTVGGSADGEAGGDVGVSSDGTNADESPAGAEPSAEA